MWPGIKEHVVCRRRSARPGGTGRCTIYGSNSISIYIYPALDPSPAADPTLPYPPPAPAAAAAPTPFMGQTAAEIFEESQIFWSTDILNHPNVKSRDDEMGLFLVCLPCILANGADKKILSRYPFNSSRWI